MDDAAFDPRGEEVALYGEWDVNGKNPALEDACRAAGLDRVAIAFYETESSTPFLDDEFNFPCDAGVYESRIGVLQLGSFHYAWRAYELGRSTPVMESSRYELKMTTVGEFTLQAVDFIRSVGP